MRAAFNLIYVSIYGDLYLHSTNCQFKMPKCFDSMHCPILILVSLMTVLLRHSSAYLYAEFLSIRSLYSVIL